MAKTPRITFIGAGSTVFMKNVIGDVLQMPEISDCQIALMDIDGKRLEESAIVARRMIDTLKTGATVTTYTDQKEALEGADFVIVTFQIGGYDPCTVTDFEIPKKFGLRQTIADTLGVGGIMRGVRTVPHLWLICEDMRAVCPDALLIQYVNPMAINMLAINRKYPDIKNVGLCHSVRWTAWGLSSDLGIPMDRVSYLSAGINHIAFFLKFEEILENGEVRDLYPDLKRGYAEGHLPRDESQPNRGCVDKVRYEMMKRLGYFVTESSEHFSEYTPWFIKRDRPDLIKKFEIPLDEYPRRCRNQMETWNSEIEDLKGNAPLKFKRSFEYAPDIIRAQWTGNPAVIYGNVMNDGLIDNLPKDCVVEVPCLVDRNGLRPTRVGQLPQQLAAVMQSSVTVQQLTVEALMTENPEHLYHAAMMDPHTGAELDLDQIWNLMDELRMGHGEWLPTWAQLPNRIAAE